MTCIRIVLQDQISQSLSALTGLSQEDLIVFYEDKNYLQSMPHHPKKIALQLASMRHLAEEYTQKGYQVFSISYDHPQWKQLNEVIEQIAKELTYYHVVITEPSEYQPLMQLQEWKKCSSLHIEIREDDRFLCPKEDFYQWAKNRKELTMEYFYRMMRQKYRLLVTHDLEPFGGKWNFDSENRKVPKNPLQIPKRISHKKSDILKKVLESVRKDFSSYFGNLDPFYFAVTREQALKELSHFIKNLLPVFGDYQDAMIQGEPYMFHSLLSSYLNIGLILPLEACLMAQESYLKGMAPLNSVEGFIRQILGWREFVRGVYWIKMPAYKELNFFKTSRPLPKAYWGHPTHMQCLKEAILHTQIHAYSHHIQRLMVSGNFALLAGFDVKEVQKWYLCVYSDAYEWVEMPNTLGMALFGDGGIIATKPYAASGKYIQKMSNFCQKCFYDPNLMTGDKACPLNALYWNFLHTHQSLLKSNHRLSYMYATWEKFSAEKKENLLLQAQYTLKQIEKEDF